MGLELESIIGAGKAIWVKNTSKNPKGVIGCTFTDPNGGNQKTFIVPATWIPVKVSGTIPTPLIASSMDFLSHLQKGMLTLIDPSDAEKIMQQGDAQEEFNKLFKSPYSQDSKVTSKAVQEMIEASNIQAEQTKSRADLVKIEDEAEAASKITARVLDIVHRFNTKDLDAKTTVNQFRCIEDDVNADDCNYIIANCDGIIRQWAKDRLEVLVK